MLPNTINRRPGEKRGLMLHTKFCDMVGSKFPIVQADMGEATSLDWPRWFRTQGGFGSQFGHCIS